MGLGEQVREGARLGVEEAVATIVGPTVSALSGAWPSLVGEAFERAEPFRRAALLYELHSVEERIRRCAERTEQFTYGSVSVEASELSEEERAAERTRLAALSGVLRARAGAIERELYPPPFGDTGTIRKGEDEIQAARLNEIADAIEAEPSLVSLQWREDAAAMRAAARAFRARSEAP